MRSTIWDLIMLGELLHTLEQASARRRILATSPLKPGVLDQVRDVLRALEQLELDRSDQAAADRLSPLIKRMEEAVKNKPRAQLGPMASELRESVSDLYQVVRDEAIERSLFVVPYDPLGYTEKLLTDPRVLFRVNPAHPVTPPQHAIEDLQEAAECYAIGRPAAAIVFSLSLFSTV